MRQALLVLTSIVFASLISCGSSETPQVMIKVEKASYQPGEKEALTVLKAYAEQDLKTLKSYASGANRMVLDKEYFNTNSNAQKFRGKIKNWTGSFKEIRYYKEEKNFQKHYYLIAVIHESPSGQLTGIGLKSKDKENWKLSGMGTKYIKKEEFQKKSTTLPE